MSHLLQEKGMIYFGRCDIQNFQQCLLGVIFFIRVGIRVVIIYYLMQGRAIFLSHS